MFWIDVAVNVAFYIIFISFTWKQVTFTRQTDTGFLYPPGYALIPRLLAGVVLVFSILWIRYYIKHYSEGRYSARELLIITHTVLFILSIASSIAHFGL